MEQITYPEITLLVIEASKSILGSRSYMFDPDQITSILFDFQGNSNYPLTSANTDILPLAEEIQPRSEWGITPEQAQQAKERLRQKRAEERARRMESWGR